MVSIKNANSVSNTHLHIEEDRTCYFHQLYKDKDQEHHKYFGPAYKCVSCEKYGCNTCLNHKSYATDQRLNMFICSPCYYRHQVKQMIHNLKN